MSKRRLTLWLLSAASLMLLPTQSTRLFAQSACGPFVDVSPTDPFCPFILQAFISSVTQGTSSTTFSPNDLVPRNQTVTFFDRVMDITLHRGSARLAMGKTWAPSSTIGAIATDVGGAINDVVTDGTFLWIARNDGKVLKVNVADRRVAETWSLASGLPRKLGIFGGLVWIVDNQGALQVFNPTTSPAGTATVLFTGLGVGNFPTMSFDGTNVWVAGSSSGNILVYPIGAAQGATFTAPANVDGMVFDGTNMWVLLSNAALLKLTAPILPAVPTTVETLTIPGNVSDCRMLFDGTNVWIPQASGSLYVIRVQPNPTAPPSLVITVGTVPNVSSPYVAGFDGENVMIGGINNGTVAIYKATSLTAIRSFSIGAGSIRSIASDGRTFNIGDATGTKFFQY
jgi:hypothetical protein